MANQGACIYVIRCGNMAKIGIAADPYYRLQQLQTGNPEPLSLQYFAFAPSRTVAVRVEKAAHKRLADRRVSGEWFRVDHEAAVETVAAAFRRALRGRGPALPEIEFSGVEEAVSYLKQPSGPAPQRRAGGSCQASMTQPSYRR